MPLLWREGMEYYHWFYPTKSSKIIFRCYIPIIVQLPSLQCLVVSQILYSLLTIPKVCASLYGKEIQRRVSWLISCLYWWPQSANSPSVPGINVLTTHWLINSLATVDQFKGEPPFPKANIVLSFMHPVLFLFFSKLQFDIFEFIHFYCYWNIYIEYTSYEIITGYL